MKEYFLNFDTINGVYNNNAYDCKFVIQPSIKKCKKIYLKSIEIPITFNNIRNDGGSTLNQLIFSINSVSYNINLTNKIYSNISDLLTDINSYITSNLNLGFSMIFSLNTIIPNLISISFTSQKTIEFTKTNLSYNVLGFNGSYTGTIITSTNNYLLNVDNYINLNISNLPCSSHNNYTSVLQSYKVQLNTISNTIYYIAENNNFQQYLEITDTNYIIDKIHLKITDRWGFLIYSNVDYSITLMFLCDE